MKKSDLIQRLTEKFPHLTSTEAKQVVDTIFSTMAQSLIENKRVELRGFGSFTTRKRAPRKARNPRTGEAVFLNQRRNIYFRAGKILNQRLNKSC